MKKLRLLILAGKGGGDFTALEAARRNGLVDYEIAGFAATTPHSSALKVYRENYNVEPLVFEDFKASKSESFSYLINWSEKLEFDHILLCGFTFILPPQWVRGHEGSIINSHHSILPAHPGLFKKEKLLRSDEKFLGATLHLVDEGVDSGRILSQCVFPNPGMERMDQALKTYRFAQDCMIVQLMRELSGAAQNDSSPFRRSVYFNPPVDDAVVRFFESVHYDPS